jgi:hypothetical protein
VLSCTATPSQAKVLMAFCNITLYFIKIKFCINTKKKNKQNKFSLALIYFAITFLISPGISCLFHMQIFLKRKM